MANETPDKAQPKPPAKRIRFSYIKSTTFRVIHVDGAIGAPLPSGDGISLTLYNERVAIPQQTDYEVTPNGQLGDEIKANRVVREGFVREMEVTAMMDFDAMQALHKWLGERVFEVEKLRRTRMQ